MSSQGWIKLHRTVTDSFVFQNSDRLKFWIWCLCKATHKPRKQNVGLQEVELLPGQFIFGRKKASVELAMDESKIYRLLKTFEKRDKIEVKSNNKFSVVSIVNWEFYQSSEQQTEQQSNNNLTTNEQQSNTNKNVKNNKNVKKKEFTPPTAIQVEEYVLEKGYVVDPKFFIDYFEARDWVNANGKPVSSWKGTLVTWNKKELQNNPNAKMYKKKEESNFPKRRDDY